MKKILVTGSNGYIGSHLVDLLLQDPINKVRGMVLQGTNESNLEGALTKENFSIVYADLLDAASLRDACKNIDIIYHLAAIVSDWGAENLFMSIIFQGTKNLAEAAIENGVKRIIYMSSVTVHGFDDHVNANEDTPYNPIPFFPYSKAKIKAESLLLELEDTDKIKVVIIRPGFDIIGSRHTLGVYQMAKAIEEGKFGVIDNGKKLISLVYVKNLVAAMVYLADIESASGEAYIVSDVSWSWAKYMEAYCSRLGCRVPKLSVPFWLLAPFVRFIEAIYKLFKIKQPPLLTRYRITVPHHDLDFSSKKLNKTGFKPPYTIQEGLDDAINWYLEYKKHIGETKSE